MFDISNIISESEKASKSFESQDGIIENYCFSCLYC